MPTEQITIGSLTAVLCVFGLWKSRWLVENTRKGAALIRWFGEAKAVWVLRGLFLAGFAFGILLATDVLQPVRW